jgi:Brix domain
MAGPLGVTHMILFSRTETGVHLRIARTPRGPTLHFKVHSYSLSKDVKNHQKAPKDSLNDYLNPPLVRPLSKNLLMVARSEWLYHAQGRQTFSRIESPYIDLSTSVPSPVRTNNFRKLNPSRPPLQ